MHFASEGETVLSDKQWDGYILECYGNLKKGILTTSMSDARFRCPYCYEKKKTDYSYRELIRHAYGHGRGSNGGKTTKKARHVALEQYAEKYLGEKSSGLILTREGTSSKGKNDVHCLETRPSKDKSATTTYADRAQVVSEPPPGTDANEKFVWPWFGVLANIPIEVKGDKTVMAGGSNIREDLVRQCFNPLKFVPLWNFKGFSGFALLEFGNDWDGLANAMMFEKSFEAQHRGKREWKRNGDRIYGWIARQDDYDSRHIVVAALGTRYFELLLPDIIRNCSHQKASVRDGYLTLFKYFPRSLGVQFQKYLQLVLPAILDGLADENESVRDAALSAGRVLVEHYATTSLPLLLPAVEDGIFNDSWRIRQSSVELLGDLLFKVAGTSGKAILEGGSDDEGSSTEAHGRAIIEILGMDKRNEVLAALYMVRTDVNLSVRQAALHVWKTIVSNTPKTLREIMPVLMNTLIISLASPSSERRQAAGRALGELVRKLGERVLPLIIPNMSKGLKDSNPSRRQGVCIGLSEVMASAGKHQLLAFMDDLIPTIRTALCDSVPEVRESAGLAFSTLYKSAGMQAIDEIVPTLLHALEDDQTSDTALDGLKQILSVRAAAVLPHILPKLVNPPLSAFNAHALGALAEVAGPGLNTHLSTVLPALLHAMGDDNVDVQNMAKKAAETVVLVIDEEGIEPLLSELLKGVGDSQALVRRNSCYIIGFFFKNSELYLADEAPDMISTLIVLLSDSDAENVPVAWEALSRVMASIPKDVLPSHIKLVRDAVSTARDKERRKKKGGPVLVPGFCLPKALQPLLPVFLQGLTSGSAELREQAAVGLGELLEVTSEKALKEFVIPITGPLIRIIGDRFPWQVKSAILSTLSIIIRKGGIALKPFLPQLQTTFIKCLQDNTRTVRSTAALALGKLSSLSTRVDPLVGDLVTTLQASEGGVREAILTALGGVLKHAGKGVSPPVRHRAYTLLKDLINNDDDQVRMSSAKMLGILSQFSEDIQLADLLQQLASSAASSNWVTRHGAILTISSLLRKNPSSICTATYLPSVLKSVKGTLEDDKFPVRQASTKALGRLMLYQIKNDPSDTTMHQDILYSIVSSLRDESSEVRRTALSALKSVAKENPLAFMNNVAIYGAALGECLKDGNTPVRLAAERCAFHAFQLSKGADKLQAAQKYMSGLDARRIAKLPEHSDVSDDESEGESPYN
ncbi:unnamed protein product [Rhodiola kirilowii]